MDEDAETHRLSKVPKCAKPVRELVRFRLWRLPLGSAVITRLYSHRIKTFFFFPDQLSLIVYFKPITASKLKHGRCAFISPFPKGRESQNISCAWIPPAARPSPLSSQLKSSSQERFPCKALLQGCMGIALSSRVHQQGKKLSPCARGQLSVHKEWLQF